MGLSGFVLLLIARLARPEPVCDSRRGPLGALRHPGVVADVRRSQPGVVGRRQVAGRRDGPAQGDADGLATCGRSKDPARAPAVRRGRPRLRPRAVRSQLLDWVDAVGRECGPRLRYLA